MLLVGPARHLRLVDDERGAARGRVGARPTLGRRAEAGAAAGVFAAGACASSSGAIGEATKQTVVSTATWALIRL